MENTSKKNNEFIIKSSIIAAYLVLITWLLFIVFNTKSLSTSTLFIQYVSITTFMLGLFKISSQAIVAE
jgi:uncharacterized integral membrane protein